MRPDSEAQEDTESTGSRRPRPRRRPRRGGALATSRPASRSASTGARDALRPGERDDRATIISTNPAAGSDRTAQDRQ